MDEYALDFLEPVEQKLVKEKLSALIKYPAAYRNSLGLDILGHGMGYRYFLAANDSRLAPVRNEQTLPDDITPQLFTHGFIETDPTQHNGIWFRFTEKAFDWYRRYGGPDPDEIRTHVGRTLRRVGPMNPVFFNAKEVATAIGIAEERVREQTELLLALGFIEVLHAVDSDFGILGLTMPEGQLWAEQGFPSILTLSSQTITVNVDLRVEVRNIIRQVQSAGVAPALLEQYELRLRRVEEEIEKPDGQGRLQTVHDLVETANGSKELLIPTVGFLASHADKIKTFVEGVGNLVGT